MKSTKIKATYWILFVLFLLILVIFSYLSLNAISFEEDARLVSERFTFYNTILTFTTPLFFLILLFISNIAYYKNDISYYFWMSLLLYIVFILINYIYICGEYFHYKKVCGFGAGEFSVDCLQGLVLCVFAIFLCLINYFSLVILKRKFSK